MKYMPAGEFKAKCLKVMAQIAETGEEVVVTKHGKPVAKVVPASPHDQDLVGRLRGTAKIVGDIVAPTGEQWEADAN